MKKLILFITMAGTVIIFCTGCQNAECKTANKIFDSYSPASNEYKDELTNQLAVADKSKLTYWMDAYWNQTDRDGLKQEFIRVHIKGDKLCADMILAIKDSRRGIENILDKQMLGYKGAELADLQFETERIDGKTQFVFKEISGIID